MKTAFLTLALVADAAFAQLTFKGLPLGSDRAELTARYPSLECQAVPQGSQFARIGEALCTEGVCDTAACRASRAALATYGGAPMWDQSFAVVGGKAERFSANFDSASYETVRDALREVHGAGVESTMPMQTLGGARVASRVWNADLPGGRITLFERAGRLNEGAVSINSKAFTMWSQRPADTGKAAKDL